LGVGLTTAYYKSQESDEVLAQALDDLLEDPDFLDAVADQVMFEEYTQNLEDANDQLDAMRNDLMTQSIETKAKEGGQ